MKKLLLLALVPFLLAGCSFVYAQHIKENLKDELFKNYTKVTTGGWDEDGNTIKSEHRIIWSLNSYAYSVSNIDMTNPGMSAYWLDRIGLLTPSTSLTEYGTICKHSSFRENKSEYHVSLKPDNGEINIYWNRKTCLIMRYVAKFDNGEDVWYGYNWKL